VCSVNVNHAMTLITIVQIPLPGTLPLPPQIPRNLRSPTPESIPSSPLQLQRQSFYDSATGRKRVRDAHQSSDSDGSPRGTTRTRPTYDSTAVQAMKISAATGDATKAGHHDESREYESPASDEEPDELHGTISKAIDTIMQKDSGWVDFFRARAAPQRVSEVLNHYRFVQRMMDEWVGKRAPFRTSYHVVEAVSSTDPIWANALMADNAFQRATLLTHYTSMIRVITRPARRLLLYFHFMDLRANTTRIAGS
jgi:hypothetical protein